MGTEEERRKKRKRKKKEKCMHVSVADLKFTRRPLLAVDPSAFFMRKNACDVTREKFAWSNFQRTLATNFPCRASFFHRRAELSKSHRADINPPVLQPAALWRAHQSSRGDRWPRNRLSRKIMAPLPPRIFCSNVWWKFSNIQREQRGLTHSLRSCQIARV